MFATIAILMFGASLFSFTRKLFVQTFTCALSRYNAPSPHIGLEIVVTHLAHASTLTTKAQWTTWFMTFVSATYKGEAAKIIMRMVQELANMEEVGVASPEVQAGDDCEDIAAECLAFMQQYPNGNFVLPTGSDMTVQASWDDARSHFGLGVDCFKAIRYAPFYKHGRKIIAACLAGSLFSENLARDHKWFHKRLFEGVDHKSGTDPVDLFDEVLDLLRVVFDAATYCVQTQSIRPLLGRGKEAFELDREYAFLASHHEYYIMGTLERVTEADGAPLTDNAYVVRVERFLAQLKRLHAGSKDAERAILTRRMTDVMKWNAEIREKLGRASMRMEPYAILMLGPSAQGKTAISMSMMHHTLKANGFPCRPEDVASIDCNSNFMDTIQNSTMGVFLDDLANTKPEYQKCDPLAAFLAMKNTSVVPVHKADLSEKGGVFHNSKVLILSSNVPDLNAKITSNEPTAIMRRNSIILRVKTRPQFATRLDTTTLVGTQGREMMDMVDPAKMVDGIYTLHQSFDILKWGPFKRTGARPKDDGDLFVIKHEGRDMCDLDYDEVMRYIQADSRSHFRNQRRMLDAFKSDQELPICPHGGVTAPFCSLCRREVAIAAAAREVAELAATAVSNPSADIPPASSLQMEVQAGITEFFFPSLVRTDADVVQADSGTESPELLSSFPASPSSISSISTAEPEPNHTVASLERARARFVTMWSRATVAPPPPEVPAVVGWFRVWTGGFFDIEKLAFTHFDAVMLVLLGVSPAAATVCSSILAFCGMGAFGTYATWFGVFAFTGVSITRNARGWVSARVAGATLEELKRRSLDMAKASLSVIGGIMGVLLVFQGLRKLCQSGPVPTPKAAARGNSQREVEVQSPFCDNVHELQGGTASTAVDSAKDPVKKTNAWERRDIETWARVEGEVRNMTYEQILRKVSQQLYVMHITYASGHVVSSNSLIVATNYMVAPAHNFLTPGGDWSEIVSVQLQTTTAARGPVFRVKVSPSQMLRLPGDAMLVQINSGGTMPDVLDLLIDEKPTKPFAALELYRAPSTCDVTTEGYVARPEPIACASHGMRYAGLAYTRPESTFKGLCGALVLVASRYPQVVGIHTMGRDKSGVACCIVRSDIIGGIEELRKQALLSGPVVTQNTTTPFTPLGMEDAGEIGELSKISVMREVIPGTEFKPLGTLVNYRQVRPGTRLEVSPVSAIIEEECGEVRAHEPPTTIGKATVVKLKLEEMWGSSAPNPADMKLAMEDQFDEMCAIVESLEFGEYFRVLTIDEATSGIADCHSVRAINRGTAAGWPFTGNKHPFVEDMPRPGLPDAFVLTPAVKADVYRALEIMGELERMNFVFKGTPKDEAVKIGKKKTRMFEGSPLVFTIITRMLFMGMIRMYLLARLMTGSAVGIDATGMDWDWLYRYMLEYNGTHAVVGDWVHFDTSQAYMEMMAVFTIWIAVMQKYGVYTPEHVNAMWVVAEETSRHYALFRGDLGITEGTTPSGGVLTVYLNNPIGELRFKCAFYGMAREQGEQAEVPLWDHGEIDVTTGGLRVVRNGRADFEPLLPNLKGRFADYVRGSYYGDDFMQAARKEVLSWYNQETLYAYFHEEGLELTDTDKGPFKAPTTEWAEVTFLKRHFRYNVDTRCYMGPLEMKSIYKSLHVWPKKLTWSKEVHAAQIFSGAIRELLQHGREEFEKRVPALLRAAERFGCAQYLESPDVSYHAMVDTWFGKQMTSAAIDLGALADTE